MEWYPLACETFGEPWLTPVLRAGRAADAAARSSSDASAASIREAAGEVWRTASDAQREHRLATSDGRIPTAAQADALAAIHEQLLALVVEMEASVAALLTGQTQDRLLGVDLPRVQALTDRLMSYRLASEVVNELSTRGGAALG